MRIGDLLLFAPPDIRFSDLNFDDAPRTIGAFEQRIKGFYLKPARILLASKDAFACGVLCCTTIDCLTRYSQRGRNQERKFVEWLRGTIIEFANESDGLATRFYRDFRHGLVHEGRIKNNGQFSLDIETVVLCEASVMVVHPGRLLDHIDLALRQYCEALKDDTNLYVLLAKQLEWDFKREIAVAAR